MTRGLSVSLVALLLASALSACGSETERRGSRDETDSVGDELVAIPGLELGRLTREERRLFRRVLRDQLSPCGDPVSLAVCVAESRECRSCRPAARYVQRLVMRGYGQADIEERLAVRYGAEEAKTIPVGDAPVRGSAMAPITVVEFSDFECPACGAAHPIVSAALQRFPDKVRLVMMHYPLPSHPHAGEAARAAVAAGRQNRFWEMHDLLFEHQHELTRERMVAFASELDLDLERFEQDLDSQETQRRVEAQKELGRSLGVEGTPTFFINGRMLLDSPQTLGDYLMEEIEAFE